MEEISFNEWISFYMSLSIYYNLPKEEKISWKKAYKTWIEKGYGE